MNHWFVHLEHYSLLHLCLKLIELHLNRVSMLPCGLMPKVQLLILTPKNSSCLTILVIS